MPDRPPRSYGCVANAEIGKCFFNLVLAIYCGNWTRWWAQVIIPIINASDIRLSPVDEQLKEPGFLVRKRSHMVQEQHQLMPLWDTRSSDTADFGDHMFASYELATRLMSLQRTLFIYLNREGLALPLSPCEWSDRAGFLVSLVKNQKLAWQGQTGVWSGES